MTDGCFYYRLKLPLDHLLHDNTISTMLPTTQWDINYDALKKYDLVIGQRVSLPGPSRTWRELAKLENRPTLVYELDDDLLHVPSDNPGHQNFTQHGDLIRANIFLADAVTVSTEPLAEMVRQYNPNVFVLPNCIGKIPRQISRPTNFTLGWTGSSTHYHDLRQLLPQLQYGALKYDWNFTISDCVRLAPQLEKRTTYLPWTRNVEEYYELLNFDIGLCPLLDSSFTRSKSNIKALELMARGIPVIASDVCPYQSLVKNGYNGYLVKDGYAAVERVREIQVNRRLWQHLHEGALATAGHYQIADHAQDWLTVYEQVIGQPQ